MIGDSGGPLTARAAAAVIAAALAPLAAAHATGYFWCANTVASATSPHVTTFRTAPPYALQLVDAATRQPVGAYTPGATYGFSVVATSPAASPVGGFILCGFSGTQVAVGIDFIGSTRVGAFAGDDVTSQSMADDGAGNDCTMCITHVDSSPKPSVNSTWAAPAAGTGLVTFYAIVVQDYVLPPSRVYLTVAEIGGTPVPTPTPPRTPSAATTPTKTPTGSRTGVSATTTSSPSPTGSPAASSTASSSATVSGTAAPTPSRSAARSPSRSPSGSRTGTRSLAPSHTAAPTPTGSRSRTRSHSVSRSRSRTRSHSHKVKA